MARWRGPLLLLTWELTKWPGTQFQLFFLPLKGAVDVVLADVQIQRVVPVTRYFFFTSRVVIHGHGHLRRDRHTGLPAVCWGENKKTNE